jgi:predicted transcriptional regulator of viral defense system
MGLAPENLNRLAQQGLLIRRGRGIYEHPDFDWTENHSYVQVAKAVPDSVMCLLTALSIHGVGTQLPHEVWIAIPRGRRPPKARNANLKVVTMSHSTFDLGIETMVFEELPVRVYSLEKTLVDCFRLQSLVGHDVGVEALRDALSQRKVNLSNLTKLAQQTRTWTRLRPYLEAAIQ